MPRELTTTEIAGLVEAFAATARRAVAAGFRAVNLHFAHSYLVHQFLSPDSNFRTDAYGGSLENRMRFALEIVAAIRAEAGTDFALDVKLNGRDFVPGGIELDESAAVAGALLANGADGVSISGGVYGSSPFNLLLPFEDKAFLPLAKAIRAATGGIVTAVGKIRTPADAAEAVRDGACDLVGVSRAVMADPDWALKALGRLPRPVRPCLGTLDGCSERLRRFEPATCQVMPEVGRELRRPPAGPARRIAIVGAGPAGLEAAVYAAELGDTRPPARGDAADGRDAAARGADAGGRAVRGSGAVLRRGARAARRRRPPRRPRRPGAVLGVRARARDRGNRGASRRARPFRAWTWLPSSPTRTCSRARSPRGPRRRARRGQAGTRDGPLSALPPPPSRSSTTTASGPLTTPPR